MEEGWGLENDWDVGGDEKFLFFGDGGEVRVMVEKLGSCRVK